MASSCIPLVPGKHRPLIMTGGCFFRVVPENGKRREERRGRERRWAGHAVSLNSEGAVLRRHHVRQLEHLILDRAVSGDNLFKPITKTHSVNLFSDLGMTEVSLDRVSSSKCMWMYARRVLLSRAIHE